jgi:hypothetical protein
MATKKAKAIESPEAKLSRWYEGQDHSEEMKAYAQQNWEAGAGFPMVTIGDEHFDKFYNEDETAYVVVCWTDVNGCECIG